MPVIRSSEILVIPAACASSAVCFASSAVCILPSFFNSAGTALCIPIDKRLKPVFFIKAKSSFFPLSGFTSTVISALLSSVKFSFTELRISQSLFAPRTLGVPPPIYTVFTVPLK